MRRGAWGCEDHGSNTHIRKREKDLIVGALRKTVNGVGEEV